MSFLERNLEAVRRWMPESAVLISAAAVPPGFQPATGTDGTATYRREVLTDPRRVEWLGGTSMPQSSAIPLAGGLNAAAGNGLGLSMGTGFEWAAFAQRLSIAHAIFVYEADPALARMALEICDLSALLATGKIILFTGPAENASSTLALFLSREIGFDPPSVLHPLCTLPAERRNAYLATGEAMVRRVVQERHALNEQLAQRVEAGMGETTEAVVAMTVTPRYPAERPLALSGATSDATIFVDRHDSASIGLRLRTMAELRPRKIVSDLFRTQLACVPPLCAVETWVPPLVGAGYWERLPPASALLPADRVIVHGESQQARFRAGGFPSQTTVLRPLPVGRELVPSRSSSAQSRVGLFGDLISVESEKLGVTLPTHIAVLDAAADIICTEHVGMHEGMAEDVLRRALARANVPTTAEGATDPALRDPMLRLVRDVLIPTLPLVALAQALMSQRVPLCLMGDWAGMVPIAGADVQFTPLAACRWEEICVFVHLSPTGMPSPVVWEAVAASVAIAAPQHPTDRLAGALPTLLKAGAEFAHPAPQQLVGAIQSLMKDEGRREKLVEAAHRKWVAASQGAMGSGV